MRNFARSIGLFRPLADQGDAWAQIMLGIMYVSGQGVPKDAAQAAKWFRLAADQGDAGAQHNLGDMYEFGRGVPQDYVDAHKWFNLSAARAPAADIRKEAAKARDDLAKRMIPAQVAEAQKRASAWQPK